MSILVSFFGPTAFALSEGIRAHLTQHPEAAFHAEPARSEETAAKLRDSAVIVADRLPPDFEAGPHLRLLQVPGAGYDKIPMERIPGETAVCNCFGHEAAIAEYTIAALLWFTVPLADSDRHLRRGDWRYFATSPTTAHGELAGSKLVIVGLGRVGKAIARLAKAFSMNIRGVGRNMPSLAELNEFHQLDELAAAVSDADYVVTTLPATAETAGLFNAEILAAMPSRAVIVNVGRGTVVDEDALFEALQQRRIRGAIIDTWYEYPSEDAPAAPSKRAFHTLDNIVMTSHMAGWTSGTITRRQREIASNIDRVLSGREPINRISRSQR